MVNNFNKKFKKVNKINNKINYLPQANQNIMMMRLKTIKTKIKKLVKNKITFIINNKCHKFRLLILKLINMDKINNR